MITKWVLWGSALAILCVLSVYVLLLNHKQQPIDCLASFGAHMDSANVDPDHDHGVRIQVIGESGKWISWSIYPSEAITLAQHLIDTANPRSSTINGVQIVSDGAGIPEPTINDAGDKVFNVNGGIIECPAHGGHVIVDGFDFCADRKK